jgi:predicted GNAT family N-acyltransferase
MASYSNVSIVQLTTAEKRADALKVRIAVFVDEQKYSLEDELDRYTNANTLTI